MEKYFRATAYLPTKDISFILDSHGIYDEAWELSSLIVKRGFKLVAISRENAFDFGDLPPVKTDDEHVILRACGKGQPLLKDNSITVNGKTYSKK